MLLVYSHIRLSLAFHCGFGSREFLDWSLCILHRFPPHTNPWKWVPLKPGYVQETSSMSCMPVVSAGLRPGLLTPRPLSTVSVAYASQWVFSRVLCPPIAVGALWAVISRPGCRFCLQYLHVSFDLPPGAHGGAYKGWPQVPSGLIVEVIILLNKVLSRYKFCMLCRVCSEKQPS